MKRQDGIVVADNYSMYDQVKRERILNQRIDQLTRRIEALEALISAK